MRLMLSAVALTILSGLSFAADAPATRPIGDGKFVDLFNGKDLTGWKIVGTGCEAEVKDGCVLIKAGNGVVRTEKEYKDFVLEFDWKALGTKDRKGSEMWDSGVYFRCGDPVGNRPWPAKYQCNLRKGMEGDVAEIKGTSKGLCKDREWNHFKLTVIGETAALEINGQPAWKAGGITEPKGFIHLQAEVPGGGQFLFKNVRVLECEQVK
jgi:hypothetical protein